MYLSQGSYLSSLVPPAFRLSIFSIKSFLWEVDAGTSRFCWQLSTSVLYSNHLKFINTQKNQTMPILRIKQLGCWVFQYILMCVLIKQVFLKGLQIGSCRQMSCSQFPGHISQTTHDNWKYAEFVAKFPNYSCKYIHTLYLFVEKFHTEVECSYIKSITRTNVY